MLAIPEDIKIDADQKEEKKILDLTKRWLEQEPRTPGIHVSDLLDPKRAWFKKKDAKRKLTDREAGTFLVGKVLHAFIESAAAKKDGLDLASDGGSRTSKSLGIEYSIDHQGVDKIPVEVKTSRSMYAPKGIKDLSMYAEQLLCYMVAENQCTGKIWVLYLNLKDEQNRTSPEYRCYTVTVTKKALAAYKAQILKTRKALESALTKKTPDSLDHCRTWLCGERMCEYWHKCKPKKRYGRTASKWDK